MDNKQTKNKTQMNTQLSNETITIPVGDKKIERPKVNYLQPRKIRIDYSFNPDMGIGVFATETIEPGELIERCPMVQLAHRSRYHHDPQITRYVYTNKNCGCKDCMTHGHYMSMVLGYGMLYNHQDNPNTEWRFEWEKSFADVTCTKRIEAGEEIFVSYGNNYFKNRPYFSSEENKNANHTEKGEQENTVTTVEN